LSLKKENVFDLYFIFHYVCYHLCHHPKKIARMAYILYVQKKKFVAIFIKLKLNLCFEKHCKGVHRSFFVYYVDVMCNQKIVQRLPMDRK